MDAEVSTKDTCPRCAADSASGVRFCRRCGQSLAAPTPTAIESGPVVERALGRPATAVGETRTEPAPTPLANGGRIVPAAAAPASDTRIEPTRGAAPPPPPAKPASRTRWRTFALVAGVVAAFGAAAVGTYVMLGPDDSAPRATGAAAQSRGATPAPSPSPQRTSTGTSAAEPAIVPGRYVRLGSFRFESAAQRTADTLQAKGIDAAVIPSNDAAGMFPAFFQVVQGPLESAREERRALRAAERAGVAGPFVKSLTPVERGDLDPSVLGGDFEGTLQQTNAKVDRLNRKLGTTMSFAADGESGTVAYDRPSCRGTLQLESQSGRVLAYSESIDAGRCSDGGTWYLRPEGDELFATWWRPDDVTFVIGTLQR
jgi:hypothetical protein